MKVCCRCRQSKSLSEFGKRTRNKDKLEFFCKSCAKAERDKYADRKRELDRKRYSENREYFVAKSSKTQYARRGTKLPEKYEKLIMPKRTPKTYSDILEAGKQRKRKFKDKYKLEYKMWSSTEHGKLLNSLKSQRRRARIRELPNTLLPKDVLELLNIQDGRCADCSTPFSESCRYEIDHIVPVILGGGLTKENTQLLCRSCNAKKGTKVIRYIKENSHQSYGVFGE